MMPVTGGVRRSKNRGPNMTSNGDAAVIRYSGPGKTLSTDSDGRLGETRLYIPGNFSQWANPTGPSVVSYYNTGVFKPGCSIRWEPNVSFTTGGRVYVGWTDNPETTDFLFALLATYLTTPTTPNWLNYINQVRALGSCISFPIWQETDVPFPTRLRRKRFDVNNNASPLDINVLDRSMQQCMWIAIDTSDANTTAGNFQFRDVVDVEGLQAGSST